MSARTPLHGWHNNNHANHFIMRKRRQGRMERSFGERIRTTVLVILMIFGLLFVGMIAETYIYYQHQLPLIDSIAHHSLFQTTRIYDRHGKLLYELYDHQI